MTGSLLSRVRHEEAGFSLIEILVATLILSVVLALVPQTFRLVHDVWRSTVALDRETSHQHDHSFLITRLAEAMPIFEQGRSGTVSIAFWGASDSLSFVAPSPNGPDGANLYRFHVSLRPTGAGSRRALVVTVSPYVPAAGAGAPAPAEEHSLFEDVVRASIRYFGRTGPRAEPSWQPEWARPDALPDLVEISLASGPGTLPRTITVELRLRRT